MNAESQTPSMDLLFRIEHLAALTRGFKIQHMDVHLTSRPSTFELNGVTYEQGNPGC